MRRARKEPSAAAAFVGAAQMRHERRAKALSMVGSRAVLEAARAAIPGAPDPDAFVAMDAREAASMRGTKLGEAFEIEQLEVTNDGRGMRFVLGARRT